MTKKRAVILLLPFVLIAAVYTLRPLLINIAGLMPGCMFNRIYHLYCPGCGNTRSVFALMRFDFALSLRENITPIVLVVSLFTFYLEEVFGLFGKNFKSPLRYKAVWISLTVFMIIYFVARNFIPQIAPI